MRIHLESCPAMLTAAQSEQYARDGYVAFRDVLSADEVAQARNAISELVRLTLRAPDVRKNGAFWSLPDSRFGIQFEPKFVPTDASDSDLELKLRKLMWYCDQHPFFDFLAHRHPKIRGVTESVLGKDPILFQDMALIKPPFIGSEKPWHQDDAYFSVTPLDAVAGVWIALDDATAENGCMRVLAGAHHEGPRRHFHGRDCEIVPERIEGARATAVELPAGGAMFFHGLLPHFTPANNSPHRRRALQFHYRAASSQIVSREEYDRIFVERDGTPASCAAASKS